MTRVAVGVPLLVILFSLIAVSAARKGPDDVIKLPSQASRFFRPAENDDDSSAGTRWAVLVAGSSGYWNYRHQADICHAYQLLRKGGLKEENIVVFMYDDIANNYENPRPGTIINSPHGKDVYQGVPKDYTGDDANVNNLFAVILGDKTAIKGGSGKVVDSGPNDHIFIFYSDHGGPGVLGMPTSPYLYADDLNDVLKKKHALGTYKSLVFYLEACESGSIFEGLLEEGLNIYATTASNAEESSWGTYCPGEEPSPPPEYETCLGDLYSVAWMEDSSVPVMDNSKPLVIPTILKGENYLTWARTTKTVLCGRGLWNHIVLEAPKQATKPADKEVTKEEKEAARLEKESKWFQEDQAVLALLQSSLDAPILEAYSYCETTSELWETLKTVFGNVSNLTRVFEVRKAINNLSQEDGEFTKHFGKFRSLWAEFEMLRPNTMDAAVLNERGEQDKVFALLLTLNPTFNYLIKHILRSDKLGSLDEVCAQIQKEQGSVGLFSSKGELPTVNKGVYKHEDRRPRSRGCEHCKRMSHTKDKCWLLHPHLRPTTPFTFKDGKAHLTQAHANEVQEQAGSSTGSTKLEVTSGEYVTKTELETLLKSFAAFTESGY